MGAAGVVDEHLPPVASGSGTKRGPTISQLNAQLNRTVLSHDDFGEARQYLQALQVLDPASSAVIRRALLTAAVIAYCRPFSGNEAHDLATSTASVGLKQLSAEQRALHDKLMGLRHEAVAHSDYERRPVSRMSGGLTGFSYSGAIFDLLSQGLDLRQWVEMCNRLIGESFQRATAINRDMALIENPSLKGLVPPLINY